MYNIATVTDALFGLVGFRQPYLEGIDPIDSDLTTSSTGLYIDGAHELLTAPNLQGAALAFPGVIDRPQWSAGTYAKAAVVGYNNKLFRSLSDANVSATTDATKWAETTPLSVFLRRVMSDAVGDVLSAVRTRKLARMEGKTRLAKTELFDGQGSLTDAITPAGRFVGIRVIPKSPDAALKLSGIGVQFTGPVTALPFYVYGDGEAAILSTTITTSYGGRFAWPTAWESLALTGSSAYFIGYYEDDLPSGVLAVRRDRDLSTVCIGCSPTTAGLIARWKPYVAIDGIRIDPVELNEDRTRWDWDAEDVIDKQNYGLNLQLTVECDITDVLVSQSPIFAEVLRQQIVVKLLNAIAYSPITSSIEQMTRSMALRALGLDGTPNLTNEVSKLDGMLNAVDIELSGIDTNCLPVVGTNSLVRKTTAFNRR